ncbi:hypothetical protein ACWGVU_37340, partial [Embleya sp. NPDC055610]
MTDDDHDGPTGRRRRVVIPVWDLGGLPAEPAERATASDDGDREPPRAMETRSARRLVVWSGTAPEVAQTPIPVDPDGSPDRPGRRRAPRPGRPHRAAAPRRDTDEGPGPDETPPTPANGGGWRILRTGRRREAAVPKPGADNAPATSESSPAPTWADVQNPPNRQARRRLLHSGRLPGPSPA